MHDRSDGFYRRQIVLMTKDKPADRIDDPFLVEKMVSEKEGIFIWCLKGLKRLIENNYRFTISDSAKNNISVAVKNANNIIDFLSSKGYVIFNADSEASTKSLYNSYKLWCDDNAEIILSAKSFSNHLAQYAESYHLKDTNNVYIGGDKRCRGYKGIKVIEHKNIFL